MIGDCWPAFQPTSLPLRPLRGMLQDVSPAGGRQAAWYWQLQELPLDASVGGTASLALGSSRWVLQWAVSERDGRAGETVTAGLG